MVCLAISVEYRHVTDGQTDGRTSCDDTVCAKARYVVSHSKPSRGKTYTEPPLDLVQTGLNRNSSYPIVELVVVSYQIVPPVRCSYRSCGFSEAYLSRMISIQPWDEADFMIDEATRWFLPRSRSLLTFRVQTTHTRRQRRKTYTKSLYLPNNLIQRKLQIRISA